MNQFRATISAFFSVAIMLSCRTKPDKIVELRIGPLSPFHYSFSNHDKRFSRNVNDYYFLNEELANDSILGRSVLVWLQTKSPKDKRTNYHSIYIYNQTELLNRNFKGARDDLTGIHNKDLRAYIRFTRNKLDILYLIKDGKVTYDVLKQEILVDPFDF